MGGVWVGGVWVGGVLNVGEERLPGVQGGGVTRVCREIDSTLSERYTSLDKT